MPDTRGRPLPSEILPLLKDPSITNWLRSFLLSVASSESIGRYPGNGSAQDDQYVYPDDADATFAYNFDYVVPSNFQRLVSAKLSFRIRPFRSYNNFSATATGGQSNTHVHSTGGETGHSHSHSHSSTVTTGAANARIDSFSTGWETTAVSGTTVNPSVNTDATGSSGHNHGNTGGASADHTHPVSITSTLGIFEDIVPVNPGLTVKVDGVDVTTKVGGPFNSDQVEIDVTQVVATGIRLWHTLSLQPNQRVRITGILRLSYYVDSRLAQ